MKGFKPTGYGPSAGFKFPANMGFTGSTGAYTNVQPYIRRKPQQFADGGFVRQDSPRMKTESIGDQGSSLTRRKRPYAEWQRDVGATSSLLPGFKDGGASWIAGATKNKGALHRALHVPQGEKIPAKKLAKAARSGNPKMRQRAVLAETLGKMKKANGGRVGVVPKPSSKANPTPIGQKRSQPKPTTAIKTKFYDAGGKVEKPRYWDAVKDRVKEMLRLEAESSTGLAKRAADRISGRERQIDDIVNESVSGNKNERRYAFGGMAMGPKAAVQRAANEGTSEPSVPVARSHTTRLLQRAINEAANRPTQPVARAPTSRLLQRAINEAKSRPAQSPTAMPFRIRGARF